MKKILLLLSVLLILSAFVLLLPDLSFAQPPPPPSKPVQNPIDGGLSILAVAGGAYAYKKLRDKKQ